MAKTITLNLEDHEMKALESEFIDVDAFFQNFVNHRYQLREKWILDLLVAHCNENGITIATGVSAQIDQAHDLGLCSRAEPEVYNPLEKPS